ncbi:hypothetical protein EEB11_01965 [Pseudotabrizicola sediminis]|uniref:Uncharacterized protein n=1 Tax=Pseudotabrizicola sediminis TaxID=2486418 RepID=A0ABY2KRC9_9RHOB|nr:hypothetical protein EEB11_01965 [Pseudotabrizicola sediminis]
MTAPLNCSRLVRRTAMQTAVRMITNGVAFEAAVREVGFLGFGMHPTRNSRPERGQSLFGIWRDTVFGWPLGEKPSSLLSMRGRRGALRVASARARRDDRRGVFAQGPPQNRAEDAKKQS